MARGSKPSRIKGGNRGPPARMKRAGTTSIGGHSVAGNTGGARPYRSAQHITCHWQAPGRRLSQSQRQPGAEPGAVAKTDPLVLGSPHRFLPLLMRERTPIDPTFHLPGERATSRNA